MNRKILSEIGEYPVSKIYEPTKTMLLRLDQKLPEEKSIPNDKK